jgi:hypothetical protein
VITHNVITLNGLTSGTVKGGGIQAFTIGPVLFYDSASLKIEYNDVTGNEALTWGGGIYVEATSQTNPLSQRDVSIKGNLVRNNRTNGTSAATYNAGGGGIWVRVRSHSGTQTQVVVTQNIIEGNSSPGDGPGAYTPYTNSGGGLWAASYAAIQGTDTIQITNNTIRSNLASGLGGGVALFTYTEQSGTPRGTGTITMEGNIVEANTAYDANAVKEVVNYGGGIWSETAGDGNESILIQNNQIRDNDAKDIGGGISAWGIPTSAGAQSLIVEGNTVTGNTADGGGGLDLLLFHEDLPSPPQTLHPVLRAQGNTITNNRALGDVFGYGGGIDAVVDSTRANVQDALEILGNVIQGNTATFAGGGVMLTGLANGRALVGSDPRPASHTVANLVLKNNLITGNSAIASSGDAVGGGVYGFIDSEADAVVSFDLTLNTIANNASDLGGIGGLELEIYTQHTDPTAHTGPNGQGRVQGEPILR